jgi:hypothetical protein
MFRKLLLSAVLTASSLTGLGMTAPAADAHPPVVRYHHEERFVVLVRHYGHWDPYGTYRERCDADRAAERLRDRGFDVRIEFERG